MIADVQCVGLVVSVIADVECVAVPITGGQFWEADLANNSAAGQVGQRAILTDHDTVNNTGSDASGNDAMVRIVRVIGAATDKKALVKFMGVPTMDTD